MNTTASIVLAWIVWLAVAFVIAGAILDRI